MWAQKNLVADKQSAFMTIKALKMARLTSGFNNAPEISIWSATANQDGHSYLKAMELKLKPKEAEAIVKDPVSAKDFMACFPTDATFLDIDMADELQTRRLVDQRIDFGFENFNAIRDQHKKNRASSGFLNGKAALLGGIDLVYLSGHSIENFGDGVWGQRFLAGTSSVHGMCGVLRWGMFWDEQRPDYLILEWFGQGESYFRGVDWVNNIFVRYGFDTVGASLPHMRNFRLNQEGSADFPSYLWSKNKQLYLDRGLVGVLMAQRFGELMNEIFRNAQQFDASQVQAQHVKVEQEITVPVLSSLDAFQAAINPAGKDVTGDKETVGAYYEDSTQHIRRQETSVSELLGASILSPWAPEDEATVATKISAAISSTLTADVLKQIQDTLKKAAESRLAQEAPVELVTPADNAAIDKTVIIADRATVTDGLIDHNILQVAFDLLDQKKSDATAHAIKDLKLDPKKYSAGTVEYGIRRAIDRAIDSIALGDTGFLSTSLNTVALKAQLVAYKKAQITIDPKNADAALQQAKDAVSKATTDRDKASAQVDVAVATANSVNAKAMVDLLADSKTKLAASEHAEQMAAESFAADVVEQVKKQVQHYPTTLSDSNKSK